MTETADPFDDMDDAELGALARHTMAMLSDISEQEGVKRIAATSAALFLVAAAVRQNAARVTVSLGGATVDQKNTGDWIILVLRPNEPEADSADDPPVTLSGWLHPDKVQEAIQCFEKLTVCQIAMQEDAS